MAKVVLLSFIDYAHSGRGLYEAVKRHTDHQISFFDIKRMQTSPDEIQSKINDCDIVHLKGDWPWKWYKRKYKLKLGDKPLIQTVAGSAFRRKGFGTAGKGTFTFDMYKNAIKTSLEPDLLYDEYQPSFLIPYPIDSLNQERVWKWSDPPILSHIPSQRVKKDSDFILCVFQKLAKRRKVRLDIPSSEKPMPLSFDEVIERKKNATIYFDQFLVGAYGNSAVEAMQYGIPTACWLAPYFYKRAKGEMDKCPVISTKKDVSKWVELLDKFLGSDIEDLSVETKIWCDSTHSYQAVAKRLDNLYKSLKR